MRCIIAGSRTVAKADVIEAMLQCPFTNEITVVVSGTARGADTFGEEWARSAARQVARYPADWNRHGKSAGFIRNRQMAENADALVAVWDGQSRGTANMIKEAEQRRLRVFIHNVGTGGK